MRTPNTQPLVALIVVGALTVGACDFDVTDPNSPSPIRWCRHRPGGRRR